MKYYSAPWGKLLKSISVFATLICVGASVILLLNADSGVESVRVMLICAALPLLILVAAGLLTIRGYAVSADEIVVQRPVWSRRFERSRLQSATVDATALHGSIRLFGNGGLYSFSGIFRSPALGRYRVYVTDPSRCVVLRFSDRAVVVSPEDPAAFVRDVESKR